MHLLWGDGGRLLGLWGGLLGVLLAPPRPLGLAAWVPLLHLPLLSLVLQTQTLT